MEFSVILNSRIDGQLGADARTRRALHVRLHRHPMLGKRRVLEKLSKGKDESYWRVLKSFVSKMKEVEAIPPEERVFRF